LEENLKKSGSGRRSLKKYEITNLLFFLTLIIALGVLVVFVFRSYGTRNQEVAGESGAGVLADNLNPASDMGIFYLGTTLSQTSLQYRNRIEVPATDDGLIRDLFSLDGVDEVTVNQRMIIIRKDGAVRWEGIGSGVRQIVKNHLHIHY
jgi:hypothetical protein